MIAIQENSHQKCGGIKPDMLTFDRVWNYGFRFRKQAPDSFLLNKKKINAAKTEKQARNSWHKNNINIPA